MSDLYNEMLQKSIDRQAKKITANGATAEDRYGHFLDSVKGRNLEQEEEDRKNAMISRVADSITTMRERRGRESQEHSKMLNRRINDVKERDRQEVDDYLDRNKRYLDKAKERMKKERSNTYFS